MTETATLIPDDTRILWAPDRSQRTRLHDFIDFVSDKTGKTFDNYNSLHNWSISENDLFWESVWDFTGLIGEQGNRTTKHIDDVPWVHFFPNGQISYVENIFSGRMEQETPAIIARNQGGQDRVVTWSDLAKQVSLWEQALRGIGVEKGDCVGVYLPNIPETVIIFLAAANIGAVFCSAGMEMGGDDLINRFSQARPRVFISSEGYTHGDKLISRTAVVERVQSELDQVKKIIILPNNLSGADVLISTLNAQGEKNKEFPDAIMSNDLIGQYQPEPLLFFRHDFNHPLYVLFSSGSTGKPKCFEHSSGGILLKHVSELVLHCNITDKSRLFYHATPSWMMWNWLVSGLVCGATIMLYDGSPAYPDALSQWRFTVENRCTHHGTAAPLILSWMDQGLCPQDEFDLGALQMVLSTGAVLPAAGYHYIHEKVKEDVKISSISGGTDIVGCFLGGNPLMPTYAGQINGPILGMDVQAWTEDGARAAEGEAGELVCLNAFPSMPLRFLNDTGGERYEEEYFRYYPSRYAWRHGDSIKKTPQGQFIILGRSDATLNQNGVRIGTAAIYIQLEPFGDYIADSAAVDFVHPKSQQSLTILFLELKDKSLNEVPEDLQKSIKRAIKDNITPYAIPTEIIAVPAILKTPNGKKAEVVIKKIINGKSVPNPSLYGSDNVSYFEETASALRTKYTK